MQKIPFIDLFKSALHVSGDKLAYPPEHFLTLYTGFATMHQHWCQPAGRQQYRCSVYTNKQNLLVAYIIAVI